MFARTLSTVHLLSLCVGRCLRLSPGCAPGDAFAERERKEGLVTPRPATVNEALRRVLKGRERKLHCSALCSNEVAPVDAMAIVEAIRRIRPRQQRPLQKLPTQSIRPTAHRWDEPIVRDGSSITAAGSLAEIGGTCLAGPRGCSFLARERRTGFSPSLVRFVCLLVRQPQLFPAACTSHSPAAAHAAIKLPTARRRAPAKAVASHRN